MEVNVSNQMSLDQIVAACEHYWLTTGVDPRDVAAMKAELSSHLADAEAAGKKAEAVIGRNVEDFAEAWASEYRLLRPGNPPISPDARSRMRRKDLWSAFGWVVPVALVVAALVIFGPKENVVDDPSLWRWLWLGLAVFLGIGEMVTAGFFMLPFAAGAAVAALLAFFGVLVVIQLIAFIVVSLVALWGLRKFAWSDNQPSYPLGSKRFMNATALVIQEINRSSGVGRVRMDTEEWRATTDSDVAIPEGAEVRIVDVRGARLVVEPRD